MRNVVVTGGAGFLGSHLVDALLARGDRVRVLDSFTTGRPENLPPISDRLRVTATDVGSPVLDVFLRQWNPELIYHLASPASPAAYAADPYGTIRANVTGTLTVTRVAEELGARVVFTSTSEVYGEPLVSPQPESYRGNVSTTGPRACYDESKRLGETIMALAARRGVDATILRIFNTYGPRMDPHDGRVISTFARQALAREPLTVFGDGSQTRSFTYVDDTVRALLVAGGGIGLGPFNVGSTDERTVLHIADLVRQLCDDLPSPRKPHVFLPLPGDDPTNRRPDVTAFHAATGWQPRVGLADGILRTLDWMRDERRD